jgi:DNA-binding NtrC family response regulator
MRHKYKIYKELARIGAALLRFFRGRNRMTLHFETIDLEELALKLNDARLVLIVDDEVRIADTLAAILRRSGFRTMVAYDATTALNIAQATPPDLLLSDVVMPGLSGVDLALAVRQTIPKCKILLFSGQAATMDLLAAARDAGQTFTILAKPLHPTKLLAWVAKVLEVDGLSEANPRSLPRTLESRDGRDYAPTVLESIA